MIQTAPCGPEDSPFLFKVYASTRREEVAAFGWDPAQEEAFLRMQFDLQQRAYAMQFPGADQRLILQNDQPVGRVIIFGAESEIRLVDVAILPALRNGGIGAAVIASLQAEAAGVDKPLRLRVLKGNPARRLYERLGFVQTAEEGTHDTMEWRPPA